MKIIKHMFVIMFFCAMSSLAAAEVLLIERTRQHNEAVPKQGQSMQQVENQYGQALIRHKAVGEPPITRWEYADFVVYFEHNLVLDTVFKHTNNTLKETP